MIDAISVDLITPSPYQHRRHFDAGKLTELARSIERDGLIEPVVVRPLDGHYELIAGERRLRASRISGTATILARIVDATDAQARRMCAAENLQREDLSAVEMVEAVIEMVDAELGDDNDYKAAGYTPTERVKWLLGRLAAVDDSHRRGSEVRQEATDLYNKFIIQVGTVFGSLPRSLDWRSFYNNDFPLVTDLDPSVRDWAIAHKLNKAQAKALNKVKRASPRKFEEIVAQGGINARDDLLDGASAEGVIIPLQEVSARELETVANRTRGQEAFIRKMERLPAPMPPPTVTLDVADAGALPLANETVDLIVTSPPYGLEIEYALYTDLAEGWHYQMQVWLTEMWRIATWGGRLALNVPFDTIEGGRRPTWPQACKAAIDAGWIYRWAAIWNKDNISKTIARGSVDSPSSPSVIARVEIIGAFYKGEWPLDREIPPDMGHDEWLEWTNGLWSFPGESHPWEDHPAPFPIELPRRLIKLLSYPGDTVLDPFVGSGTTALAAFQLGRKVFGYDHAPEYISSAKRRLAEAVGGVPHDRVA